MLKRQQEMGTYVWLLILDGAFMPYISEYLTRTYCIITGINWNPEKKNVCLSWIIWLFRKFQTKS